jgi:hypothetical protein
MTYLTYFTFWEVKLPVCLHAKLTLLYLLSEEDDTCMSYKEEDTYMPNSPQGPEKHSILYLLIFTLLTLLNRR